MDEMLDLIMDGALKMGLNLTEGQALQICRYHDMLTRANAVTNLTRVPDDPREAVDRNYLDALTPLAHARLTDGVRTLCDAGSGAGIPGIVLSIALPEVRVVMMDALGKRVAFLRQVIEALNLNAEAHHTRLEDAGRNPAWRDSFDAVTARAVAGLDVLVELCMPLVRPGGHMIAYKGPALDSEIAGAQKAIIALKGADARVLDAPVPGRDWSHRLFVLGKAAPTPRAFPRKAGEAARHPLSGSKKEE
ncbi:MAG: 16S rRNA (guanine(527)-N(7))-methyltransferase RsmG [Clostridia bacterium]|nr:16S rRNA (guanine(527)-N(7))-methyltransferase RsmG [Clostridia bacterium]